jgi:hypothetical protein
VGGIHQRMKLYAERPVLRTRQVLGDVLLIAWVITWVRIGARLHELVTRLAGPGEAIERAGQQLAGASTSGGARVDDLPVIGGALRRPFDAIADGGGSLARAGELQQDAVAGLALILGASLAALPILWLASRYLPWRAHLVREATAAARLRAAGVGDEVFALRAIANRPLRDLARVSADPWADLTAGRCAPLAALELEALGLRSDAGTVAAAEGPEAT